MAWRDTVSTAPTIRTEYRKMKEQMTLTFKNKPIAIWERSRTIYTDEHPGVTLTAAQAFCDTRITDTAANVVDAHVERVDPSAQYKAVSTVDSAGAWSQQ